ncbi:arsenite efflux transporter metallochaperone ArsD [Candidatus Chloroploca sp. M-50]|uniref:Arsenite efflux transporter metallochaperone ArsD n=1 Tax=Candidatus Chloroploca mongolica TaxID=2528176 RepID=A0ABS4D403_9CHLR|nr:arsenite efflux transporter metallochaperone ArsD [Candidatus Chloroploca mongolica]MBP1464169.1 arsenite efflux transporter metallochaperone ArsD [Candidatus Chloroploca mongolica]
MSSISLLATAPAAHAQADVALYDPPMCCSTGLCGPAIDQSLLDTNELVVALKARGLHVERYQMASAPQAFIGHPEVMRLVRERNMEALPITTVRGTVIKSGAYPTATEIEAALEGASA